MIELLKKIPVDLGQGAVADLTEGKQIAKRLVPDGRNRSALDVGARNGTQSQWLKTRGYTVRSIDVEPRFESCELVNANEPLPFDTDSFDLIWCSEVIEHLVEPKESLQEMLRVCKPGGRIILTTPNSYMWLFRMLKLVGLPPFLQALRIPITVSKGKNFWIFSVLREKMDHKIELDARLAHPHLCDVHRSP